MIPLPLDTESPTLAAGAIETSILREFRGTEALREPWDKCVAQWGGCIYMSYDWVRTWWEYYGAHKELRVFLFYAGGELVSVLPIYLDRIGMKPLQLVVARLVCSNIPPKAFDPPLDPRLAHTIFRAVLAELLGPGGCDVLSVGPIFEKPDVFAGVELAVREARPRATIARERSGVHTVFQLPKTLDEFFEPMDKDERKKRKYEMRLLGKESSVVKDVILAPEASCAEFDAFVPLHALQWGDKGKLGHFGSWPKGEAYNRALVEALSRLGRVRFVRILSDGAVISSQFAFVFAGHWFWELPARSMERKWNRYSLGTTGFLGLVEAAIQERASEIEGGLAHYDYKQKLGGVELGLETWRIVSQYTGSCLRVKIYDALRSILRFGYYKVWYARVCPRLPTFFRRPIWAFWLRLDF